MTLNTPILQADISQRVAFAEAFAAGKTVADLDPTGRAAQEVERFITELVRGWNHEQKDRHERAAAGRVTTS